MKSFLCIILLLPCLLAAEVQKIPCPNGSQCPFGKYCCELPAGESGCCDLPKEDLDNKNLLPALQPFATVNNSMAAQPKTQNAYCYGTQCGVSCIPVQNGVCCPNPSYACPKNTRCCSNYYTQQPWCCGIKQRCYDVSGYCRGGAASISATMVSMFLAFIMVLTAKHMM